MNTPPIVDTKIIKDFLSYDEIFTIEKEIEIAIEQGHPGDKFYLPNGELTNICYNFFFNKTHLNKKNAETRLTTWFVETEQIILKNIYEKLGNDVEVFDAHLLDSVTPYGIHTDGIYGQFGVGEKYYAGYTCVIPLEDTNSNTIIFDQYFDETKSYADWIKKNDPPMLCSIDEIIWKKYFEGKYFTDFDKHAMKYMSIETIFPWEKGALMAASRYKFHTSDDFTKNNVKHKRAIVLWTAMPFV
jgi:hypothetical protein